MQEKSDGKNWTASDRLERLRVEKQMTWNQVAKLLAISPSMIYQVRAGTNRLSPKALHRLGQAEEDAGLLPRRAYADAMHKDLKEIGKREAVWIKKLQSNREVMGLMADLYEMISEEPAESLIAAHTYFSALLGPDSSFKHKEYVGFLVQVLFIEMRNRMPR